MQLLLLSLLTTTTFLVIAPLSIAEFKFVSCKRHVKTQPARYHEKTLPRLLDNARRPGQRRMRVGQGRRLKCARRACTCIKDNDGGKTGSETCWALLHRERPVCFLEVAFFLFDWHLSEMPR